MLPKILLSFILLFAASASSFAESENIQPVVFNKELIPGLVSGEGNVRAGLLYDREKNLIVWQKDMHYAYPIASLTKMMVALLATEDIKLQKRDWSDEVVVYRSVNKSPRSRQQTRIQEKYTLESLIQLAMLPSHNEACSDIGRHLDGSVNDFVLRMNRRAAELGMKSTFFSNPSGLPGVVKEVDNSSSPHDLLLLCLEMLKHEELMRISSTGYAEISNGKSKAVHRNHNRLVIDYENIVDGFKTGFTRRAGYCLAATSQKDDYRLISIVLGAPDRITRNQTVASMLNSYYNHLGCGPMAPSLPPAILNVQPTPAVIAATESDGVEYKTVWTKQKKTHTVKSGESLSVIAKKYNSTYTQIKKWNDLRSDRIQAGQKLAVYVNVRKTIAVKPDPAPDNEAGDDAPADLNDPATVAGAIASAITESSEETPPAPEKKPAPAVKQQQPKNNLKYVYHTVQPGDTLWNIAKKYKGITPDDIKQFNSLSNADKIQPGTKLKIKIEG